MSTQSHISGYHATTTAISSCVVQQDPTILEKENSTIRSCISSLTALRDNLLVTESPGLGWSSHLLQLVGGRGEKEDRIDEHRDQVKCNLFAIIWWLSGAIYMYKILTLNFANCRNWHKRPTELNQNPRIIDLKQKCRNSSTNSDKVIAGQRFKCKMTLGNLAFI